MAGLFSLLTHFKSANVNANVLLRVLHIFLMVLFWENFIEHQDRFILSGHFFHSRDLYV